MSSAERLNYESVEHWTGHNFTTPREVARLADSVAAIPAGVELVADLGGGAGALQAAAAGRADVRWILVERSRTACLAASSLTVQGDVSAIPLPDAAVPMVTVCEVLEHLPVDVFEKAVEEIGRVAAEYVLVTVPNNEDRRRGTVSCSGCGCSFNVFWHLRSFSEADLSSLLEPSFEAVSVRPIGPSEAAPPWWLVRGLRSAGIVPEPAIQCVCPQCGLERQVPQDEQGTVEENSGTRPSTLRRAIAWSTRAGDQFLPMRSQPWLLALYRRR